MRIFDNRRSRRENRLYLRMLRGALRGDKTVARIIWACWCKKYVMNKIAFDPRYASSFKFDVEKRNEILNETYIRLADYLKRPSSQVSVELGLVEGANGWLAPESLTDLSLPFDARIKVYARRCLEQSVSATSPKTPKFSPPSCKEEEEPAEILERWERISIVNKSFAEISEEDFVGAVIFRSTEVDTLSHRALQATFEISEESCRARKARFRKKLETKIRRKLDNNERPQTTAWGAANAVEPPSWNMSPDDDFEAMTPRDVAAFEKCRAELENPDRRAARQRELQERAKRDEENAERWTKQRKRERRTVNVVNPPDNYYGEIAELLEYTTAETVTFRFEEATRNEEKPRWRATFVVPPNADVRVVVSSSSRAPRCITFGQTAIPLNDEGEGRLARAQFLRETRRARAVVCSCSSSDGRGARRGRLMYNFGCAPESFATYR